MNIQFQSGKCYTNPTKIKNPNIKIIISGTHNNRLECFFNKYTLKSKHFNNCCIIKINRIIDNICASIIYSGDYIDSSCWTLDEFNKEFENINININLPEDTEIYLVRHGKGIHNSYSGESLLEKIYNKNIKDPSLDKIGVEQAKAAGKFLNGFINYYNSPKIYFTASHLIRTQQTVGLIMEQMNIKLPIYIAPCTHELIYIKSDIIKIDCDCSSIQNVPVNTNTPICNLDNMCPLLTKYCHTNCYNTNPIPLNWDYYKLFYKTDQKCCNNNMLHQIIRTIQLVEYPN